MALLQQLGHNVPRPGYRGRGGRGENSLQAMNIAAQKATSKCSKCGIQGHWWQDRSYRQEDIDNYERQKAEMARVGALALVPANNNSNNRGSY